MLELRPQYWLTTEELRIKREQLHQAETENQQLRQQLQTAGKIVQPDYEATRDRVLAKLKVGRQSAGGKAIDAFIKELSKSQPPTPSSPTVDSPLEAVPPIPQEQQPPRTWEARADDFLKEVAGNG